MLTKSGFNKLQRIARKLSAHPVKTGVVTSSTRFEAEIVLKELFSQLRTEITTWKIPATEKRKYLQHFADPSDYFDVVVSANDSSETRLKPHRDLYTIALGKLGISENELDSVIGFEVAAGSRSRA
jgi:phosphoglycolate phosphatase-like HAD superfamily hydrolase